MSPEDRQRIDDELIERIEEGARQRAAGWGFLIFTIIVWALFAFLIFLTAVTLLRK